MDYTTAVDIAGGNKFVAVRYVPLMLTGSTRTWLNGLPAYSINAWLDFHEAFIRNFSSTYKRPGRPFDLSQCRQGKDESDRDYLTRWSALRNSCEGVHEVQAISYFVNGCREGSMLHHKLLRTEPATLGHMLKIADKYVMADSATQIPTRLDVAGKIVTNEPARRQPVEAGVSGSRRDGTDTRTRARGRMSSRTSATAPRTSRPSRTRSRLQEAAGA